MEPMEKHQFTFENDTNFELILFVKPINRLILTPFFLFGLLVVLLPIGFFFSSLNAAEIGRKVHFSHFILVAFSLMMAYYFMKVILWNLYGKEVFKLEHGVLTHYSDFKLFKLYGKDHLKEIGSLIEIHPTDDDLGQTQFIQFKFTSCEISSMKKYDQQIIDQLRSAFE
jgi:hypothetical protein